MTVVAIIITVVILFPFWIPLLLAAAPFILLIISGLFDHKE